MWGRSRGTQGGGLSAGDTPPVRLFVADAHAVCLGLAVGWRTLWRTHVFATNGRADRQSGRRSLRLWQRLPCVHHGWPLRPPNWSSAWPFVADAVCVRYRRLPTFATDSRADSHGAEAGNREWQTHAASGRPSAHASARFYYLGGCRASAMINSDVRRGYCACGRPRTL